MNSNQFEMTVCVNGRPVREYGHKGLTFVEGRDKQPYTIKFRNNSARRIEAIFSVDGLSVIDGKPAEESRGYVIPAYQSVEIKGWRESLEKISDFIFKPKAGAYATETQGEDINCGVIAVKVYDEKVTEQDFNDLLRKLKQPTEHHHHHWHPPTIIERPYFPRPHWGTPVWCIGNEPTYTSSLGASGPVGNPGAAGAPGPAGCDNSLGGTVRAMNAASFSAPDPVPQSLVPPYSLNAPAQEHPDFDLGTGWGESREDKVSETKFERGIELACFSLYYATEAGLKKAGIEVDKKAAVSKSVLPRGFNGFCKPPKVTS